PSLDKKLENIKKSVEVRFLIIFRQISKLVKKEETDWERSELEELNSLFKEASELAKRDRENKIDGTSHSYSDYFEMREKQFRLLQEMLDLIDELPEKEKVNNKLAVFIDKLGEAVHTNDTARAFLKELHTLKENFKQVEHTTSYQDFEVKSVLFQLLQVIERYLTLKVNLMEPQKNNYSPQKSKLTSFKIMFPYLGSNSVFYIYLYNKPIHFLFVQLSSNRRYLFIFAAKL